MLISVDVAWRFTIWMLAAGIALSSIELLAARNVLDEDGVLSRRLVMLRHDWARRALTRAFVRAAFEPRIFVAVLLTRLALAFVLVACPRSAVVACSLAVLNTVVGIRIVLGRDGADQMQGIAIVAVALGLLAGSEHARVLTLCFIGAQGVLSYVVAGIAKAVAAPWWTGKYLRGIVSTDAYGDARMMSLFHRFPVTSAMAAVGVIVFETLFGLVLVLPTPAALVWLGAGLAFHLFNAVTMGLNNFVWAFVGTYAGVLVLRAAALQQLGW